MGRQAGAAPPLGLWRTSTQLCSHPPTRPSVRLPPCLGRRFAPHQRKWSSRRQRRGMRDALVYVSVSTIGLAPSPVPRIISPSFPLLHLFAPSLQFRSPARLSHFLNCNHCTRRQACLGHQKTMTASSSGAAGPSTSTSTSTSRPPLTAATTSSSASSSSQSPPQANGTNGKIATASATAIADASVDPRKLTPSCSRCRAKKLKCDTQQPCSNCIAKGLEAECRKDQRIPRGRKRPR